MTAELHDKFPPIEELISLIQVETGLAFTRSESGKYAKYRQYISDGKNAEYRSKHRGAEYEVCYSTYTGTSRPYISVRWDFKLGGGSSPCDSVSEALNRIKHAIAWTAKERESGSSTTTMDRGAFSGGKPPY